MPQPPLLLALKAQFPSPMKRASHEGDIVDIAHSQPTPTVEDYWISSGKILSKFGELTNIHSNYMNHKFLLHVHDIA